MSKFIKGARVETADERLNRKEAARIARNILPGLVVPEPEVETVKRAAYQMAKSNLHKPWARRYMRALARSFSQGEEAK